VKAKACPSARTARRMHAPLRTLKRSLRFCLACRVAPPMQA
jgi:hypothetical protein